MAEGVAFAAAIGSILKAIGTTATNLNSVASASKEAQQIATQVQATEAILKSLKLSLEITRPDAFFVAWTHSTNFVLGNVEATIKQLNEKLGVRNGISRLSLWGKTKWPYSREETIQLQQHMQGYMQMLSIAQVGFVQ